MRKKQVYTILTFPTNATAIAFESYCQAHNLPGRIVPTPQRISAGCGLAWRVTQTEREGLLKAVHEVGLTFEAIGEVEMW